MKKLRFCVSILLCFLSFCLLAGCNNFNQPIKGAMDEYLTITPADSWGDVARGIQSVGSGGSARIWITHDIDTDGSTISIGSGKHIQISSPNGSVIRRGVDNSGSFFSVDHASLTIADLVLDGGAVWDEGDNTGLSADDAMITVDNSGELILEAGTDLRNNDNASGNGGAVYSQNSRITMNGGTISMNKANSGGGGVYIDGGTFTMNSETIANNNSNGDGGGVYIKNGAHMVINPGGLISGNVARRGGGIFIDSFGSDDDLSTLILRGEVSANTGEGGGGVYIIDGGSFILEGGSISNNTAQDQGGGGVYIFYGGNFILESGTISGNRAIALGTNSQGGGVLNGGGNSLMKGGTITNNYVIGGTDVIGSTGGTDVIGGGVCIYDGSFFMSGGTIANNHITGLPGAVQIAGGGVYHGGGAFLMSGSSIEGNTLSGDGVRHGSDCYIYGSHFLLSAAACIATDNPVYLRTEVTLFGELTTPPDGKFARLDISDMSTGEVVLAGDDYQHRIEEILYNLDQSYPVFYSYIAGMFENYNTPYSPTQADFEHFTFEDDVVLSSESGSDNELYDVWVKQ